MTTKVGYAILTIFDLFIAGYILLEIFAGGPATPFLQLKIAITPDKTLQNVSCDGGYRWKVLETQKLFLGNLFETGQPSKIYAVRYLELTSSGSVLTTMTSGSIFDVIRDDQFPTGEAFTRAYLYYSPKVISDSSWHGIIKVPSSKISEQNFDSIVQCLSKNRAALENAFDEGQGALAIGSIMRVDDTVSRDYYVHAPEFVCTDGRHARTYNYILDILPVGEKWEDIPGKADWGTIGYDGKVYKMHGNIGIDTSYGQAELPNVQCTNNEGTTVQDYLASIPTRITVLNN
jgi:hypothetical protein